MLVLHAFREQERRGDITLVELVTCVEKLDKEIGLGYAALEPLMYTLYLVDDLRALEGEGYLERHIYPELSPSTFVRLTPEGHSQGRALAQRTDPWMKAAVGEAVREAHARCRARWPLWAWLGTS